MQAFCYEYYEIFHNRFFQRTLPMADSEFYLALNLILTYYWVNMLNTLFSKHINFML